MKYFPFCFEMRPAFVNEEIQEIRRCEETVVRHNHATKYGESNNGASRTCNKHPY